MATLSREEYREKLLGYVGDRTDDDSLSILEDFEDSFKEESGDRITLEQHEAAMREQDESWRKRYKDRFSGKKDTEEETREYNREYDRREQDDITIENLFEEE